MEGRIRGDGRVGVCYEGKIRDVGEGKERKKGE